MELTGTPIYIVSFSSFDFSNEILVSVIGAYYLVITGGKECFIGGVLGNLNGKVGFSSSSRAAIESSRAAKESSKAAKGSRNAAEASNIESKECNIGVKISDIK